MYDYYVGSKHQNHHGSEFIILEDKTDSVYIQWCDSFKYREEIPKHLLPKAFFRNPYAPSVKGVGYRGVGPHIASIHGVSTSVDKCWRNLITRTSCEKHKLSHPYHSENSICEDWKCFQTFGDWHIDHYRPGYEIDKDLLIRDNRHYSPETCVFLPKELNTLIMRGKTGRGEQPPGVFLDKNGYYIAKACGVFLGSYGNPDAAFMAYKVYKEKRAKELSFHYKSRLDPRAFDALQEYTVSIDD